MSTLCKRTPVVCKAVFTLLRMGEASVPGADIAGRARLARMSPEGMCGRRCWLSVSKNFAWMECLRGLALRPVSNGPGQAEMNGCGDGEGTVARVPMGALSGGVEFDDDAVARRF